MLVDDEKQSSGNMYIYSAEEEEEEVKTGNFVIKKRFNGDFVALFLLLFVTSLSQGMAVFRFVSGWFLKVVGN